MAVRTSNTKRTQNPDKKTSTSAKPGMIKFSSMNKQKKANFKKYQGQGR